jgi:hypothetical protein
MADDNDRTALGLLGTRQALTVNARPLQRPGQDVLLRTAVVGGPDKEGDRRVYLTATLLGTLLDVARSSGLQRVLVDRAGVRVDLYRSATGHEYEVWTLIGGAPRPEPIPDFVRHASADRRS